MPAKNEKVELTYSSKIGKRTMAITKCPENPEQCYIWTAFNTKPRKLDGSQRITYVCTECRRLRDGKHVVKDTPLPSLIAIRNGDNDIHWTGEGNGANHCCEGPKSRTAIAGVAMKRSLGAELAIGTAETTSSAITRLEMKVLATTSEEALQPTRQAASCENTEALKQFFRRCTRKRFPPLRELKELKLVDIFKNLYHTHRGATAKRGSPHFEERFLLYRKNNIAIFASDRQLELLRNSRTIVCDASFQYRPQGTYQIYRIYGGPPGHFTPLATALMKKKDRDTYDKLWRTLANSMGNTNIHTALFDNEKAAYQSFHALSINSAETIILLFLGVLLSLIEFEYIKQDQQKMKIDLSLETWTKLFGFVPRDQLVQLVTKRKRRGKKRRLTIGDRQFVSFVEFFLHKCGQITLGNLEIKLPTNGNGWRNWIGWTRHCPVIVNEAEEENKLPLSVVPMPDNITNFRQIEISYFDKYVLDFLLKFKEKFLFSNVILLLFCSDNANTSVFTALLANVLPLITNNIHCISLRGHKTLALFQTELFEQMEMMFASVRIVYAWYADNFNYAWYCDLLYTPLKDGNPRVLVLNAHRIKDNQSITLVERVKQDFMHSNQAISFFIHIYCRNVAKISSLSLDNCQTQEKLVIKEEADCVTISRYPIGASEELVEEMEKYWGKYLNEDENCRKIAIDI